jgi:hypothetical protein
LLIEKFEHDEASPYSPVWPATGDPILLLYVSEALTRAG